MHGDAIEADLHRFYHLDLLDFERGDLSVRKLAVLVRQLPADSALSRALNGGEPPMTRSEHFLADLWSLWAKQDHPVRAAIVKKARDAKKAMKHRRMQAKYGNRLSKGDGGEAR